MDGGSVTVRAVVFDYKAVLRTSTRAHDGVAELLHWLAERDVAWVLLSSDPMDAAGACAAAGLPQPALHLCRDDIPGRPARGSGAWLTSVAEALELYPTQLLLVGTTEWDWYTGIQAGVVYVHARWAKANKKPITSLLADSPDEVRELLEHYLLHEPTWAYALDDEDGRFRLRSLLPPNVSFPKGGGRTFTLQDVFTRSHSIALGEQDARDVLMLSLLLSAYLEGNLPGRSLFCVYPSSRPGRVSAQLEGFLERAKVMVGSYYREDLLERVVAAPDTSLERYRASRGEGTGVDISIAAQARTVRINPDYRRKVRGKTVIVFDDFTTEGKSIEWARILLEEAGAAEVIALTVGKYPKAHTAYELRRGVTIDPFDTNDLGLADFAATSCPGGVDDGPSQSLRRAMLEYLDTAR